MQVEGVQKWTQYRDIYREIEIGGDQLYEDIRQDTAILQNTNKYYEWYYGTLRGTRRYYQWYFESLRDTTRHLEQLCKTLRVMPRDITIYRGATRTMRKYET